MNNKGQLIFFTLMLAITVIVLALSLAFPVKEIVDDARGLGPTDVNQTLDCGNSSISTFDKGACIVADLSIFHFIGGLIFLAGAILTAKIIL